MQKSEFLGSNYASALNFVGLTDPISLQIQPGVKDIRTALANAIADGQDSFSNNSPSETNLSESQGLGSLNDRLGLGGTGGSMHGTGTTTPGGTSISGSNPFQAAQGGGLIQRNSRSIRRLMSEKSFTMDTVYSGMVMDGDVPSEPLEVGTHLSCYLSTEQNL